MSNLLRLWQMVKVLFDTILYVEAERNYCRIVTKDKEYLLSMPMKSLENKLPATLFCRIHRSYLVNIAHVEAVDGFSVKWGKKRCLLTRTIRRASCYG